MELSQKKMLLDSLAAFGSCEITVSGESMKPFIRQGDRVVIFRTTKPVLPGHVIAFFNNDQLIVHRVYAVKGDPIGSRLYAVCGDSSVHSHGEINKESVIGRVHYLLRKGNKHSLWFQYPFCLLALLVGPFLRASVIMRKKE
jgi:signal peptidase I